MKYVNIHGRYLNSDRINMNQLFKLITITAINVYT